MVRLTQTLCIICFCFLMYIGASGQGMEGYYRYPALHGETVYFTAEGDIWSVPLSGGLARRITSHPEEELYASISPDGKTLAYSASYEGPTEVYTMPVDGGIPTRWTYSSDLSVVNTWTQDGHLVYQTREYSKVPDYQLVALNPVDKTKTRIPLAQASEASYSDEGVLYFVRPAYHRNVTKRYKGGTARQIWKFDGKNEAIKLTNDYNGESHHPMWANGRVYFITDRDGIMNIWSIDQSGGDLTQHTQHKEFDVRTASIHGRNIVYHVGADLWHHSLVSGVSKKIEIKLVSDFDQLREKWDENPLQYITAITPGIDGEHVVVTARGRVFNVPVKSGRTVSFMEKDNVRYRDAVFSSDGKNIIVLSDQSGEFEFISLPANGIGSERSITSDGETLRFNGQPSPDGKWLSYRDLNDHMYVLNLSSGKSTKISTNQEGVGNSSWSPDSKWLAFEQDALNTMTQIKVYNVETGDRFDLTTDRANSRYPVWSPDGKFIYFLSDRNFQTLVGSPWGTRQPQPYFDASEKLYHIALEKGLRSPFREKDELLEKSDDSNKETVQVNIDVDGIQQRLKEIPISPGNYINLAMNEDALYFVVSETGINAKSHLGAVKIDNEKVEVVNIVEDINGFDLSQDGKKLLLSKNGSYYMVDAGTSKISSISDNKIDLSQLEIAINPRDDWKQIFTDAWRMERDYFYDPNMHGVDWDAMYEKYLPLVERVTTRNELSDLIGRFVGELSALHTSVRGGDTRSDGKNINVASLGAVFSRDEAEGGFKIDYIYKADPDYPDERSPLDDPFLDVQSGDVITNVNGINALTVIDLGALIRNEVGQQVRLSLKRDNTTRDIIVKPIGSEYNLKYRDWEYSNRLEVEEKSEDKIGYLHLRAMGSRDVSQFFREFYPVFNRQGLIIDVRYNFGGNIDSFILERLLRKAWMYWKARTGEPYWNMQYAFRGHIVVLVNENTYSDGEAFADGFTQLGLGTTIGTRTWGGEIWLSSANRLTDNGLARAPMMGVYGEGKWRIEGHGYEPDIEVDNLPYATFNGKDAQLNAAIEFLEKKIAEDPREVPDPPAYPDKSFGSNKKE